MELKVVTWRYDKRLQGQKRPNVSLLGNCECTSSLEKGLNHIVELLQTGWLELVSSRKPNRNLLVANWFNGQASARIILTADKRDDEAFWRMYLLLANHAALMNWEVWPLAMQAWEALGGPGDSPERLAGMAARHESIMNYGGENYETAALVNALGQPDNAYVYTPGTRVLRQLSISSRRFRLAA